MGFIINSVSKLALGAQRIVMGDPHKQKQHVEPTTMRMIIADEPRPSRQQQIHDWINGGEAPDRATRINQKIHELHHTDYMAFPQGEGTLGIHSAKASNRNPFEIDEYYRNPIFGRKRVK